MRVSETDGPRKIRQATREDWEDIRRILTQEGLPTQDIVENISNFLVGIFEGEIIAAVGLEFYGFQALLRSLVVDKKWRDRGWGEKLVISALDRARTRGVREIYLLTLNAARYFTRFGFREVHRDQIKGPVRQSSEFAHLCPRTATCMVLSLESD